MDKASLSRHALAEMPKSPRFQPNPAQANAARVVEVLAYPSVQLLDVTGPLQVFVCANDHVAQAGGTPPYVLRVVAKDGQGVTTSAGLGIATSPLPRAGAPPDTLMVPGGPGVDAAAADAVLVDWLRQRTKKARRVASVCTGAFLLASAGLLDGKRAATHWKWAAELKKRFKDITVDPDPIYIRDGNTYTSAGITAGMDLALALVEEDLGSPMALKVARELVLYLRRAGGQSQFSTALSLQSSDRNQVEEIPSWALDNLAQDLPVEKLAERAGMSPRNFARVFLRDTGITPARFVERLRVEAARRRLEESQDKLEKIATDCGFGSSQSLRRSFLRVLHVHPNDYRQRFTDLTVN